jgi:hypothetical protein
MGAKLDKTEVVAWGYIKGFRFDDGADSPFAPAKPKAPKAEPKVPKAEPKLEPKTGDKH